MGGFVFRGSVAALLALPSLAHAAEVGSPLIAGSGQLNFLQRDVESIPIGDVTISFNGAVNQQVGFPAALGEAVFFGGTFQLKPMADPDPSGTPVELQFSSEPGSPDAAFFEPATIRFFGPMGTALNLESFGHPDIDEKPEDLTLTFGTEGARRTISTRFTLDGPVDETCVTLDASPDGCGLYGFVYTSIFDVYPIETIYEGDNDFGSDADYSELLLELIYDPLPTNRLGLPLDYIDHPFFPDGPEPFIQGEIQNVDFRLSLVGGDPIETTVIPVPPAAAGLAGALGLLLVSARGRKAETRDRKLDEHGTPII